MTEALGEIKKLKTQAKNQRDRGQYERAARILKVATSLGEKAKNECSASELQALATELADCYGIMGGVYRRWALETESAAKRSEYLRESIEAYDTGYQLDSDPTYGHASSYNRLNGLISRLFAQPELLSSSDFKQELETTRKCIQELAAQHDYWALADLALLEILLNEAPAARAYASFDAESPPDFAYESALSVLDPLSQSLPTSSGLKEAVGLLKKRRAILAGNLDS
jgi:hypothetical protein